MSEQEPRREPTAEPAVSAAGRFAGRYFAPRGPDTPEETGSAPAESRRTRRPPFRQHLSRGWLRRSEPR